MKADPGGWRHVKKQKKVGGELLGQIRHHLAILNQMITVARVENVHT